jgi:hypothetical protein
MATKPPFEDHQVLQRFAEGKIDANGIGIPSEYPKMLYKREKGAKLTDHALAEKPLKIDGRDDLATLTVNSPDDEANAIADGWFYSPSLTLTAEQEKDREIADLKRQVASNAPEKKTLSLANEEAK